MVSNSQDRDGIAINVVAGHITAISEVNQPFPVLIGHIINRTTDMWLRSKHPRTPHDGFTGPPCGIGVLRMQEIPQSLVLCTDLILKNVRYDPRYLVVDLRSEFRTQARSLFLVPVLVFNDLKPSGGYENKPPCHGAHSVNSAFKCAQLTAWARS